MITCIIVGLSCFFVGVIIGGTIMALLAAARDDDNN